MIFYIKKVIYIAFVMVCMLMAVFAIYFIFYIYDFIYSCNSGLCIFYAIWVIFYRLDVWILYLLCFANALLKL